METNDTRESKRYIERENAIWIKIIFAAAFIELFEFQCVNYREIHFQLNYHSIDFPLVSIDSNALTGRE